MKLLKNVVERMLAVIALVVLSPVMLIAALGIKLSSNGPVLYTAQRMGKDMVPFKIYKFRTMHVGSDKKGAITGVNDSRIFKWGKLLRDLKIDELPQLVNIILGTMSIIGPRPEDIDIVKQYYKEEEKETLSVLPGLASPGSIFNYTHGEKYLEGNADEKYVMEFLHLKLALDLYYLRHWSLLYDVKIVFRTLYAIVVTGVSSKQLDYPIEYKKLSLESNEGNK